MPSLLLSNHFVITGPLAFANDPSRRGLERPSVSGDRRALALSGCRDTLRAAIGRGEAFEDVVGSLGIDVLRKSLVAGVAKNQHIPKRKDARLS